MKEKEEFPEFCIVGGAGFIGRHLLVGVTKLSKSKGRGLFRNKASIEECSEIADWMWGDLLDYGSLLGFLTRGSIVINVAFIKTGGLEANQVAMQNLVDACISVGVARVIHCSTAVVVGNASDDVITERTSCRPATNYEKIKLEAENILLNGLEGKCEIIIVRPTAVFGRGGKNLLKLAKNLTCESSFRRAARASFLFKRRMNLVCVRNVVEAFLFLSRFEGDISGECFIVSDDDVAANNYYDVSRLLSQHFRLEDTLTVRLPFQEIILGMALKILRKNNANPKRIYSSQKLFQLGFAKAISFEEELKDFAMWYVEKVM